MPAATPMCPRTTGPDTVDAAPVRTAARGRPGDGAGPGQLGFEHHRVELGIHCRRVLGSSSEVDDAVQETLIRAWRSVDRFEGRSTTRTWLRRIATNVCLDMLRAPQRRARPLAEVADDEAVAATAPGPGETVVRRDEVRLALITVNRLPPRQRSVFLLREVLGWRAAEVSELLGVSVVSVNSTLQRARAALDDRRPLVSTGGPPTRELPAPRADGRGPDR
jgi:RNA polymerase sigma-70 factor (ECF subfamily)